MNPPDPIIVDNKEHRPLYLMLPLRRKVAWATCLGFIAVIAAVALPRIDRAERDLRIVATQALATNVRSAALFVNLEWRSVADRAAELVFEGRRIDLAYGYPATASIDDAIWDHRGFVFYPELGLFAATDAHSPANCSVRYQAPVRPEGGPLVTVLASGC